MSFQDLLMQNSEVRFLEESQLQHRFVSEQPTVYPNNVNNNEKFQQNTLDINYV